MEWMGVNGGEMGDVGREIMMYTIGGLTTGDGSGRGMEADDDLHLAWIFLCYTTGAANGWGATCQWDFWNFEDTPGDGLVENASAHGLWLRGSPNGRPDIAGAHIAWLDVKHNHNQGRYDALYTLVVDRLLNRRVNSYLASYIGNTAWWLVYFLP
jgi:hypothetical protein